MVSPRSEQDTLGWCLISIKTHSLSARAKEDKVHYGEYVLLTADEHDKLLARYGAEDTAALIDILDDYIGATGRRYKSHYSAIRKWCVDKLSDRKLQQLRIKNAQEAGQRVKQPQAPVTHYADLAEIDARRKAIEDKYKN